MPVNVLKQALHYARMAWYYGRFAKMTPIRDPHATLSETLAHREQNFLSLVRAGIFENPRTPYFHLFRLANCTFADLSDSVRRRGLEVTLENLRQAGVYLSHEEAKGKPVWRHGKEIHNDPVATLNPGSPGGMESVSGGSRSQGTATPSSNAYRLYRECYEIIAREEFGVKERVCGVLMPILPSPGALVAAAGFARLGQPAERWYAVGKSVGANGVYALMTRFLVAQARLLGCRVPFPTVLEKDDFLPVARWIAGNRRRGRLAFLRSGVSSATRVCAAAMDAGLDISGTVFLTSGEAISPARRSVLDQACVEAYGSTSSAKSEQ